MLTLPKNLQALTRLAARDESRYVLHGVLLQKIATGYQVVVTDGRRLAVVTGPCPPAPPGTVPQDLPPAEETEALVGAKELAGALKLAGKQDPSVFASIGRKATTLAVLGKSAVLPHLEGRYPDVRSVMNQQRSIFKMKVPPQMLAELLLAASAVNDEVVTIHFWGKDQPLILTCENGEGQSFQGCLMPLS